MAQIDLTRGVIKAAKPPHNGALNGTPVVGLPKPPGRKLANWLQSYGEYTQGNEAPEEFHLWIGLGTIAGAMQRRVFMHTQFFDVLSNMYIVLVAPPGTSRKTTALKIGQGILKHVPGIRFTTKASSPAALIQQFANAPSKEHQSLTAYSYELGTFFSTNPAEMVDVATDLYDGNPDWDKQTVGRGLEQIPHPWFNLMAATTPQWLGDYLSPTAVEGGFVSRSLFVYADSRKLLAPFPEDTAEQTALRKLLVNDLTHISTLAGTVGFEPEAREFYEAWYRDPKRFPKLLDNRTSGYYERKHIHVLKVAMALSVAQGDSLMLSKRDLQTALALLGQIEPGMARAFSTVGRNIFATDIERILHQIQSQGSMGYAEIVRANYHALERRRIDEILGQLVAMKEIDLLKGNIYQVA